MPHVLYALQVIESNNRIIKIVRLCHNIVCVYGRCTIEFHLVNWTIRHNLFISIWMRSCSHGFCSQRELHETHLDSITRPNNGFRARNKALKCIHSVSQTFSLSLRPPSSNLLITQDIQFLILSVIRLVIIGGCLLIGPSIWTFCTFVSFYWIFLIGVLWRKAIFIGQNKQQKWWK